MKSKLGEFKLNKIMLTIEYELYFKFSEHIQNLHRQIATPLVVICNFRPIC